MTGHASGPWRPISTDANYREAPRDHAEYDRRVRDAAPELLEALRDLVACAEMLEEFTDPNSDRYMALLEAQHAIIRVEAKP